jgi:hypothetical protein
MAPVPLKERAMTTIAVRLHALILTASVAAFAAAGCSAPAPSGDGASDASVPAASGEMSTDTRYPELYREMYLPEAPEAQVMSTGRQDASLADGLSIRVSTPMAVQEARDYFRDTLEGGGWTVTASRQLPGVINVANLTATKGPVTYTASFTSSDNATQINISVVQN